MPPCARSGSAPFLFLVRGLRQMRAAAALARDKAEREAQRKAAELAEAFQHEERILFLASEEQWPSGERLNPYG